MTSNHTAMNGKGVQLIEKFEGTAEKDLIWTLVPKDNGYLMQADNGQYLSLNGTIDNDGFLRDEDQAEIMTFEESGDGYLIKNPYGRYVCALGGVTGGWAWGAFGNYSTGTTVYFFALPEVSVNLTVGETYKVSGVANDLNVTDNEVIDVESDFVQGTVKNHKLATTIEDGVYVIVNTRSNKWLLNTPVDGAKKLQNVAGEPNLGDNAYLWTVTAVEGEADTYYLGNNGKYLNLPGHEQAELVSDETATVKITASTLESNAWEIFDTNTYMNDLLSGAVGSYGGNDEDPGSQWVFYKVSDVPACTYAGVEELPSDATITSGNEYLLVNIRNGNKTLLNKQNPGANACLYLNGTANAPSNNAVWTITEHEGSYYIQDQNGKYLTFSSSAATVTTDSTPVSIGWQGFGSHGEAWAITRTVNNRKEYMSNPGGGNTNSGGGWHEENDGGSRWKIYTTSTTPVGTYDVTVTGKGVGEATVVIGMAIYTFHVSANHVHNFVGNVTTPANCVDEGVKTFTCECGEGTYTEVIPVDSKNHKTTEIRPEVKPTLTKEGKTEEVYCTACNTSVSGGETIPQLTMKNAKILDGGEVLALSDCEYVLGGTEGAYSLCHGGTYYVNIRANGVNCNQTTTASAYLNLDWDDSDGDAVSIWQNTDRLGYLYIHYADAVPKWNANGSYAANNCDMYLLYADANSTNADIPGYTIADAEYVADHIEEGESYLIAAKNTHGNWFVMVPSVTGNAVGDYIAQVVTDAVTHTHEYTVENVTKDPTCAETGLKDLKCSCGHFHAAEHKNVEIPATGEHTYTYDCDTNCKVCGQKTRPEATHVSDAAYDCVAGKCRYCEPPMEATASHIPEADDGDCTTAIACSVCGQEATAAQSHAWAEKGTYTEPTFEADGFTTYNCTNSGCTKTNVVTHEGTMKVAVAELNGEKYQTLAAALSDAVSGDTVLLLADSESAGDIPEGVTLDLNGHKLITSPADLFTGCISFNGGAIALDLVEDDLEFFGPNGTYKTDDGIVILSETGWTQISGTTTIEGIDVYNIEVTVAGTGKLVFIDCTIDDSNLTLDSTTASIEGPEDLNVTTTLEGYEVAYENGTYKLVEKAPVVNHVAKIGEQGYETLAEAGDTITFLADITESVTINKSVTIDGAGKTYTGTMTGNAGLTITIENVDFVNGGFSKTTKSTTGTYTIKNCTFDGQGTYAYPVCIKGANKLVVEDCVVSNYLYSFLYVTSGTTTVSVKNVTVENCPNYAVYFASGVNNATFENLTVKNSEDGFVINNTANRSFTIKDCKMENVGTAIAHSKGTKAITCTAQGTNDFGTAVLSEYAKVVLTENATLTAPEGLNVTTNAGDGYKVIYEEGVYKVVYAPAAMIGTKGYATLGEAFADAQDGDTIVVMKDIDLAKETPVLLDGSYNTYFKVEGKNVTVNMNGMTISGAYADSGKMLVGVFSTDNGGHLTVTGNGTVNLTATAKVYSLFANYEPGCSITIENGAYNLDKAHDSLLYSGCNTDANEGITVNGGTFILGNVGTGTNGKPWIINCLGGNDNATVVNGGTFNSDISHQFWANEVSIPADLALKNNGDGTWTLGEAVACAEEKASSSGSTVRKVGYATLQEAIDAVANGKTVTTDAGEQYKVIYEEGVYKVALKVYVAEVNGEQYESIQEAVNAAGDGDTVLVIADHEIACDADPLVGISGKSITIDLNGKTVTTNAAAAEQTVRIVFNTEADGKLTMIDSVGTGSVTANGEDVLYYMFRNKGEMTIKSGNYELSAFEGGAMFFSTNSNMLVEGGNFKQTTEGWMFNTLGNGVGNVITVTGGTFNRYFIGGEAFHENEWNEVVIPSIYTLSDNGDGTWTVKNAVCYDTYTGFGYETLAEAIAVTDSITLIADVAEDAALTKSITLELGGCTYSGTVTLTAIDVTLTAAEGLNVITNVDEHKVVYVDGVYMVAPKVYVAEVNGEVFESIQEAVNAANDGDTVLVIADHEIACDAETLINVVGKDITIDLNGKAVTINADAEKAARVVFRTDANAKLTVQDSVGTGSVTANGEGVLHYMFRNEGEMTIKSGSYELSALTGGAMFFSTNSNMLVEGGSFKQTTEGWMFNAIGNGANVITAVGGTFNRYFIGGEAFHENQWNEVVIPSNYALCDNGDGTWTITAAVCYNTNTGFGYASLNEAAAAAKDGETIVLLADIAENVVIDGKSISLELNRMYMTGEVTLASADAALTAAKDLNVVTSVADAKVVYENGTYMVKLLQYVAQIGETKYDDLSDALAAAKSGETVQVIANTAEFLVMVPAEVKLDLNGFVVTAKNVLAFGIVMDTAAEVGGIKISNDTTTAFTKLQPENGGYLPIYDTRDGMYKFFEHEVVAVDVVAGEDNAKFRFQLRFEAKTAYEVLANTEDSDIDYVLHLMWTGMEDYAVRYRMTDATVRAYAASVYEQLSDAENPENTRKMTLTIYGVNALGTGGYVSAVPSVETVAEVTSTADMLRHENP